MFFSRKKKIQEGPEKGGAPGNLRRKFHHFLIERRKSHANGPQSTFIRPRRQKPDFFFGKFPLFRKFFFFIAAGGLFLGLLYTVFFSSFFTVSKVALEKNGRAVPATAISAFLDKVKGKNILFLNIERLERELSQTFKNEIREVRIKKSYPHKLIFKVEEHAALLNFLVITPEKTQQFILNQMGFAIFENTQDKELPVLSVKLPKPFAGKTFLIEKEIMERIAAAFLTFHELFGMKTPSAEWKKVERELHLKTERNFWIWLDVTADIELQLKKLKRALPKLDIYHENLEYIDLRIAGGESEKVIFKRR